VARRRARRPGLALALQADAVAAVHPRGDLHRQHLLVLDPARPMAALARIADHLAAAAAFRARLLHGEDAALEAHLAAAAAGRTGFDLAILRTAAVASVALGKGGDLDPLLGAGDGLFQVQLHHVADVGTAPCRARAAGATEDGAEDVAEDVAHVRAATAAPHALLERGMAMGVVGAALGRVGQHLVGLLAFLEGCLGRRVTRVAVGVVLHRAAAIGLLQLFVAGGALHAEHFVVVAFHLAGSWFWGGDAPQRGRRAWPVDGKAEPQPRPSASPRITHPGSCRPRPR